MRLLNITAQAHPAGNSIDLSWEYPDQAQFPGVRVVRRQDAYPEAANAGTIVGEGLGLRSITDPGLKGETVYYYALFPFRGNPPQYEGDPQNRVSAMATTPYDFAGQLYNLLPALYRRYDAQLLPITKGCLAAEDLQHGQLRRFLDLPGYQFDQIYSLVRAALNLYNLDRVDGNLLPLLAQWIGWETDFNLEIDAQRSAIRYAPYLYQAVGLLPTVEATVKRITGWESRTKEFIQNIARTNQPERLNLWSLQRSQQGVWGSPTLTSVNFAYQGRPTAVRETDGSTTFFYHTYRRHGWDLWTKRYTGEQGQPWTASQPVADQPGIDQYPAAAIQGNRLWLFWQHLDDPARGDGKWHLRFRMRTNGIWSATASLTFADPATEALTERRQPAVAVDGTGGLWLFWLERSGSGIWQAKYNRHDGTHWQLNAPATLPAVSGKEPQVEDDLFVLVHPTSTNKRLWLFWARHEVGGPPGQTRWTIAYRIKPGLDPAVDDWLPLRTLPKAAPGSYHDREPTPLLAGNDIELFWSSTQNGNWSIWRNSLNVGTLTWGTATPITTSAYSERAPLAVAIGEATLLLYRSNQSLPHTSTVYGATQTLDIRYAGSTTVDSRNQAKMGLLGKFEDFQSYTYDAGKNGVRTNDNRLARDTVGLYLDPGTAEPEAIKAGIARLNEVLAKFMPATSRVVFITP